MRYRCADCKIRIWTKFKLNFCLWCASKNIDLIPEEENPSPIDKALLELYKEDRK